MKRQRVLIMSLCLAVPAGAAAQSQAPAIQNGKVDVRSGAAIDREIAAVSAPSSTDPVWIAWKVPMVDGDRDICNSWYSDRQGWSRGTILENTNLSAVETTTFKPPTGAVQLEGGTNLVILARLVGGKVERLRRAGDDCPLDAGGRTVHWLSNVTSAESLRFLTTLARQTSADRSLDELERNLAGNAVRAIGQHRDAGANAILDDLVTAHPEAEVRRQAASALGASRGAFGVTTLTRLIASEKDAERRRSFVSALGQSRETAALDALRGLTRDADAAVRSDAVNLFVQRGGAAVIPEALRIIDSDADSNVKRRAVTAIGRLPGDAGLTTLIQLGRTSTNPAVRKEAVSMVANSKDPRAIAFLEEILRGR